MKKNKLKCVIKCYIIDKNVLSKYLLFNLYLKVIKS